MDTTTTALKKAKIQAGGPFYTSPNFIALLASALLAAGAYVTDTQIAAVAAFVPALFAVWNAVKDGGLLSFKEWIGKANVRGWLASALIIAFPALTPELFNTLWQALDAALGKNWSGLLAALFSLVTIIYKLVKPSGIGAKAAALTLLAFLVLHPGMGHAQSRRALKAAEKAANRDLENGFDFTLPPLERVPEDKPLSMKRAASMAAQTNWGKDLLLPTTVRDRLAAECKYNVVIKLTDTAPKIGHSYLQAGQLAGANYTGGSDTDDLQGHGTHCAGIIAANELGLLDVLVKKGLVRFKPIQTLTSTGSGSFTWVSQCYATERPEDVRYIQSNTGVVYSGSFGGGTSDVASVEVELKKSTDAGIWFAFAAGNSGTEGVGYPGRSQYGIGVAALSQSPLGRASYSSTGPQVWLAAPGSSINSTYKGNTFASLSGTSMATPFVAGLIAVAESKYGATCFKSVTHLRNYLAWVCTDLSPAGKDSQTGYGALYVLSILDKNPADTPSGTPNPPPPPPVDTTPVPVFPLRTLSIPIEGPFNIVWDVVSGAPNATAYEFGKQTVTVTPKEGKGKVVLSAGSVNALAFKPFTIQRVTLGVPTTTDLPTTYALTLSNVRTYSQGRGYGLLPADGDGAGAAKWYAYFLEMLLKTQMKPAQVVRVLSVEGIGPAGERVVWNEKDLPHFNK